jgi:hypothetical protein
VDDYREIFVKRFFAALTYFFLAACLPALAIQQQILLNSVGTGSSDPNPITRTYVSDGDANGVCYYAGQHFNTANTWTNPHTAGYITVAGVPVGGAGSPATLVDRTASNYSTGGSAGNGNEWFLVDLGVGRTLLANKFSYRFRNDSTSFSPTGWTWEGSNDNSSWSTLATVTGQTPVASAWVSTTAAVQTTAYRYFRVKQTGANNSGSSHMSIGELELYGTFTY